MTRFGVEITIRTKVANTEIVESASVDVNAQTYSEALVRTFRALKTCDTFQQFMDKVLQDEIKYGETESEK